MSAATNYTEDLALKWLLTATSVTRPTGWTVGLFTATPSDAGGGTEISGGSYARQSISFTVTQSSGTTTASNTSTITFPVASANWGTVTHIAVFDTAATPNMLFYGGVTAAKLIETGDTFQITAGNLTIELQ